MPTSTRATFLISCFCLVVKCLATCPAGRMPPGCQDQCPSGYFGHNCSSVCPATCTNSSCQPESGYCYRCNIGFTGTDCSKKCQPGIFGQNCSEVCPRNCFKKQCDPVTGLCDRCVPGYEGVKCQIHYTHRRHGIQSGMNETVASLQEHKHRNMVIYITAGIIACIMSVCSVILCAYLVAMKLKLERTKKMLDNKAPIYRKPKFVTFSSSKRCWPGSLEGGYQEMQPIEEECENVVKKEDVQQSNIVQRTLKTGSVDAKDRLKSFLLKSKYISGSINRNRPGRTRKGLATTLTDKKGAVCQEDGVNSPELRNILMRNAPLRLDKAANYSHDLFFKTFLPYQRFEPGTGVEETDASDQNGLHKLVRPLERAGRMGLDRTKSFGLDCAKLEVIEESSRETLELESNGRGSSTSVNDIFIISKNDLVPEGQREKSKFLKLPFRSSGVSSQSEKSTGLEPKRLWHLPTVSGLIGRRGRTSAASSECDQVLPRSNRTSPSETTDGETVKPAVILENKSKVYLETTEPLMESGGFASRIKNTVMRMLNLSRKPWSPGAVEHATKKEKTSDLTSDVIDSHSSENKKEVLRNTMICSDSLELNRQREKRKSDTGFTFMDFEPAASESFTNLPASERSQRYRARSYHDSTRSLHDRTVPYTNSEINNDGITLRKPQSNSNFPISVAENFNKNRYTISLSPGQLERLQTCDLVSPNRPTCVTKAGEYMSVLDEFGDETSVYEEIDKILGQIKNYSRIEHLYGRNKETEMTALYCTGKIEMSVPDCAQEREMWAPDCAGETEILARKSSDDNRMTNECFLANDTANNPRCSSHPARRCHKIYSAFHRSNDRTCAVPLFSVHNSSQRNHHSISTCKHANKPKHCTVDCTRARCQRSSRACTDRKQVTKCRSQALSHLLHNHNKKLETSSGTTTVVFTKSKSSRKRSHKCKDHLERASNVTSYRTAAVFLTALHARMKRKLLAYTDVIGKKYTPVRSSSLIPEERTQSSGEERETPGSDQREWETAAGNDSRLQDVNPQGSNMGCEHSDHWSLIPKSVITMTVKKTPSREVKAIYTQDRQPETCVPPRHKKAQEESRWTVREKVSGELINNDTNPRRNVWSTGLSRETNSRRVSHKHKTSSRKHRQDKKLSDSTTLPASDEHTSSSQDVWGISSDGHSPGGEEKSSSSEVPGLKLEQTINFEREECLADDQCQFKELSDPSEMENNFVHLSLKSNNEFYSNPGYKNRKWKNPALSPLLVEYLGTRHVMGTLAGTADINLGHSSTDNPRTVSGSYSGIPSYSTVQTQEGFPEQMSPQNNSEKKSSESSSERCCRSEESSANEGNSTKYDGQLQQSALVTKADDAECSHLICFELQIDNPPQQKSRHPPQQTISKTESMTSEFHDSVSEDSWSVKAITQFYTVTDETSERYYDALEGAYSQNCLPQNRQQIEAKEYINIAVNDKENCHSESKSNTAIEEDTITRRDKNKEAGYKKVNNNRDNRQKRQGCTMSGKAETTCKFPPTLDKKHISSNILQDKANPESLKITNLQEPELKESTILLAKMTDKTTLGYLKSSSGEGSFAFTRVNVSHSLNKKSDDMLERTTNKDISAGVNKEHNDFNELDSVLKKDSNVDSDQYSSCMDVTES